MKLRRRFTLEDILVSANASARALSASRDFDRVELVNVARTACYRWCGRTMTIKKLGFVGIMGESRFEGEGTAAGGDTGRLKKGASRGEKVNFLLQL